MSFCIQCGNQLDDGAKFCSKCGTAVAAPAAPVYAPVAEDPVVNQINYMPAASAPVQSAPVVSAPVQSAPVVVTEPVVPASGKALGIVSMCLGIGALSLAATGCLETLTAMEEVGMGFGMSVGFGMFAAPAAIVSMILGNKSKAAGNTSAFPNIGAKLSLAALITCGVMAFFGFINLFV